MSMYSKLFLNKVIEDGDYKAIVRHGVTMDDMHTEVDAKTLEFIERYASLHNGQTPSYALVASEVEGFEYIPDVTDSYSYLVTQLKSDTAKIKFQELFLSGEIQKQIQELDGNEFINDWLPLALDSIHRLTSVDTKVGVEAKKDIDVFLNEYQRRKEGESFNLWTSAYSVIGNYVSGNLYSVMGESGRGKSMLTLNDVVNIAQQGATVLVWSLEMGWYETMVRIYTMLSSSVEATTIQHEGNTIGAGFDSHALNEGRLGEEFEKGFVEFLRNMNDYLKGNIIVRAVDEETFTDRSLKALERDVELTGADVVLIDPFYYLDYEKNTSRKTGGDAEATSKRLRSLTGKLDIVTIAITQSNLRETRKDEDGYRELRLPERDEVMKTSALIHDAHTVITVDSDYRQGRAIVGIAKGRSGGEGEVSNIIYLPQYAVIKEQETGVGTIEEFDF